MGLESKTKTVTTAGTAVRLSANHKRVIDLIVRAMEDNSGNVYVGGSKDGDIDNTAGDIQPGEALCWSSLRGESMNLYDIWLDADTNGEGVDIWYRPDGG